jgi:hypothetical protein
MNCRPFQLTLKKFWLHSLGGLAVVCGITSCEPAETVRSYTVSRSSGKLTLPESAAEYRILGAMYPADNPAWFFKLTGKATELAKHTEAFDNFLQSIRFPNGPSGEPQWTLPQGWREGASRMVMGIPLKTIDLGPAEAALQLTISQAGGGLQGNLERWAGQVGAPATPPELAIQTRIVTTTAGEKLLRVDLTGPKNPASSRPPFMGGGQ